MKLKALLIPAIGLSIVAAVVFKQDEASQTAVIKKVATATTGTIPQSLTKQKNRRSSVEVHSGKDIAAKKQPLPDEVLVEHIQLKPNPYENLKNGERLSIFIPQEQQDYTGTVEKNYQQFDGQIEVSTGPIENGKQFSSFTVTKGPELTLIMVATGDSIYQIEIDNKTGTGTVINDQALDFFRKDDDAIVAPTEGIS